MNLELEPDLSLTSCQHFMKVLSQLPVSIRMTNHTFIDPVLKQQYSRYVQAPKVLQPLYLKGNGLTLRMGQVQLERLSSLW